MNDQVSKDEWWDWKFGPATLKWYIRLEDWSQAFGLVRVHLNEKDIPGDYFCVMSVFVKNGEYEFIGFLSNDGMPSNEQYFQLRRYLKRLGLKKARRVKVIGKTIRIVK